MMAEDVVITRLRHLPGEFAALLAEGEAAGYRFLRRVADEWEDGTNRFDRPGEALLGAEVGGRLVGVCGLSIDPYLDDDRVGRVRNVYVLAVSRGQGIGRRLVGAAIAEGHGHFDRLRLRADEPGPARLYASLGFLPCRGIPDCTHILELDRRVWSDRPGVPGHERHRRGAGSVPDQAIAAMIDDLERGYDGDAWHGPPLRRVLDGVNAEVASARPIPDGHSIWEIVVHLHACDEMVACRIQDRRAIETPEGGNFPDIGNPTPEAWDRALAQLEINHEHLLETVAVLEPSRLGERVAGKSYDIAHMIRGVVQHMAYHAGQIALLRKLVESPPAQVRGHSKKG